MIAHYRYGKISYIDYLQSNCFESRIRGEIRASTHALIETSQRLQRDQVSALATASAVLSTEMQHLERGVARLNSTFHWGFSEVLMSLGGVAASLDELRIIAKTPSKTWAYEQFDDAREAFRKELFPEALEYVNRAINGYGGRMGYPLEYRFHFCLGVIRFGGFGNNAREIVDLVEAKKAFLNAARYAIHDEPTEAARAYVCAGKASSYQGQMVDARSYFERACDLDSSCPEAFFQLAKVLMYQDETKMGTEHLRTAFGLDPGYWRVAQEDEDFRRQHEAVEPLLADFLKAARETYEQELTDFERELSVLQQIASEHPRLGEIPALEKGLKLLSEAQAIAAGGAPADYSDAAAQMHAGRSSINTKGLPADLQWGIWRMQQDEEKAKGDKVT